MRFHGAHAPWLAYLAIALLAMALIAQNVAAEGLESTLWLTALLVGLVGLAVLIELVR